MKLSQIKQKTTSATEKEESKLCIKYSSDGKLETAQILMSNKVNWVSAR